MMASEKQLLEAQKFKHRATGRRNRDDFNNMIRAIMGLGYIGAEETEPDSAPAPAFLKRYATRRSGRLP